MPEKDLLEIAASIKRFEYSLLGIELKAQTDIAKKQYQKPDNTSKFYKKVKKSPALENYSKWNLIYKINRVCYKHCCDSKKFDRFSLKSKYLFLIKFSKDLNKFKVLKTKKKKSKKEKKNKCTCFIFRII